MQTQIAQKVAAEMLGKAVRVAEAKSTIPILQCMKIDFNATGMRVESTDMECWLTTATPQFDENSPYETAIVPARTLYAIISGMLPSQTVEFEQKGKKLQIKSGSSKYNLGSLPTEDWPKLKWPKKSLSVNVLAKNLTKGIVFASPAVSPDDARYYLQGIHLQTMSNSIQLQATDGHRLHRISVPAAIGSGESDSFIIPQKVARIWKEMLDYASEDTEIEIDLHAEKSRLQIDGIMRISVIGKMIDGSFPDCDRVIPHNREEITYEVDPEAVRRAIRRVNAVSCQKNSDAVNIDLAESTIMLWAEHDAQRAEETIALERQAGEKNELSVSLKLLDGALDVYGKSIVTIRVAKNHVSEAIIIHDAEAKDTPNLTLLMPIRRDK